ncbi:MAG: four helix bundle protein [Planctomycetota bacterium]
MPHIQSFRDLRVWQDAVDATLCIFELTKRFPAEERFSMTDQMRRASRSWIIIALRCKYLKKNEADDLDRRYEAILGMLVNMAAHPEKWTIIKAGSVTKSPRPPVSPSPCPSVLPSSRLATAREGQK